MLVSSHEDLKVFQRAFELSTQIYEHSKEFPREEMYSLTDQIRRSSRSVCANIAEAWQRRRYRAAFVNKLNEVEAEIAETQTWLLFADTCQYMPPEHSERLRQEYRALGSSIAGMISHADDWCVSSNK
jgi:four helix bundle protein